MHVQIWGLPETDTWTMTVFELSNRRLVTGSQKGVLVERTVGTGADEIGSWNQPSRGCADDQRAQEEVSGSSNIFNNFKF